MNQFIGHCLIHLLKPKLDSEKNEAYRKITDLTSDIKLETSGAFEIKDLSFNAEVILATLLLSTRQRFMKEYGRKQL